MHPIEQITQELTWKIRQKELNPELPLAAIKLPEDDLGMHLGLFHNNKLITVVSLFEYGEVLQFRKFATDSEYQKMGFGKQMIEYILAYAEEHHFTKVWCNARTSASGFYEKFGFTETEDRFSKNGIDYVIMEKEIST
ncbi:GNAT family N-acetyltransferase [Pedobacter cryophilus]|uniref:GNAT family N-acetyltransferase n=1 Tax=Pedobacter cryophilus TaxID=2571271 RepID=A0A4U1C1R1_9SPHI|nr:GNAT family N-acetyltransferase [Pedobacter cryophilus]TKB98924.1 GNAT family N-acetyltransferase [Pedobacter cryophilus]